MTREERDKRAEGLLAAAGSPVSLPEAVTKQEQSAEPLAQESGPDTPYDLRVFQALRRIIRAVDLHSRKLLSQHQITGPQLFCLLSVDGHGPVTPSAIARDVHLSPSTVIGILDRLEAKGLIQRERDLNDRRLVQVSLTEQGKSVAATAPSPLQDTLAEAMNQLPEAELATIAASLDRIVEMMEVRHIDAAPILQTGPIEPTTETTGASSPAGEEDSGR
ncbi:MAG: MarR family winged helix-turn-helix transcriptional regulator [Thermoanaerobaculia bacterium]